MLFYLALIYWCAALTVALVEVAYTQVRRVGQLAGPPTDMAVVSVSMVLLGPHALVLYPFLLWLILYHTRTTEDKTTLTRALAGTAAFLIALSFSNAWASNTAIPVAFAAGLLAIPLWDSRLSHRQRRALRQLQQQINTHKSHPTLDVATRLANRPYFLQRLYEEIAAGERYNYTFALVYIELDGFESIAKDFGQAFVDASVKICVDRIKSMSRKCDVAARLNDYKFAMVLRNLQTPRDINAFSQKLLHKLALPFELERCEFRICTNIGISLYPNHGASCDELLHKAQQAMQNARSRGDNNYSVYLQQIASCGDSQK
jgi:diguanylate cyclase (GGDEF)-like protein